MKGAIGKCIAVGLFLSMSLLAGCAGWRGVRTPEAPPAPRVYLHAAYTGVTSEAPWWPAFEDTTLNRIMTVAFAKNLTLEAAVARLEQFRAGRRIARATLFPALSAQLEVSESDNLGDPPVTPVLPMNSMSPSQANVVLTAAYEMDIWGKLAAGRAAAHAIARAGAEELRALALTLAAQVARTYYRSAELRLQRDLLAQTIALYEDSHALVVARYQRGIAPSLDVYQAETNLAGARAQLALTESALATAEQSLALLLGRYPQTGWLPERVNLPAQLPAIPAGLPSALVQRRPDVRASHWRLIAADRQAAQAVAERLPAFALTGLISGASDDLGGALDPDNMIWKAIAGAMLPVFEGGRRKAASDQAEAVWQEQLALYKQSLLTAFRDVEEALSQSMRQRDYADQLAFQMQAAQATLRLATDRYLQGVSDYLPVMMAQTTYFNVRRSELAARRGLIDTHIALATALGGGWTDEILQEYFDDE